MIDTILTWGRSHGDNTTDSGHNFDHDFTERFRRHLRSRLTSGDRAVSGSWRQGYHLLLKSGERIGVTNGHSCRFVVFYQSANDVSRRMAQNVYALQEAA